MTAWALPEQHPIPADHPIPDPASLHNYYAANRHLQRALACYHRHDPAALAWAEHYLYEWGSVRDQQVAPLYEVAERNPPTLKTYDRRGATATSGASTATSGSAPTSAPISS